MTASFGISSFFAASQQPIVFSIDNEIHSAKLTAGNARRSMLVPCKFEQTTATVKLDGGITRNRSISIRGTPDYNNPMITIPWCQICRSFRLLRSISRPCGFLPSRTFEIDDHLALEDRNWRVQCNVFLF